MATVPECPICLEEFSSEEKHTPKVLQCGHSVCAGCASASLSQAIRSTLICAICRAPTWLDEKQQVKGLKTNFALLEFLPSLSGGAGGAPASRREVMCENCNAQAGTEGCVQCNAVTCKSCSVTIHKMKLFQSHELMPLAEFENRTASAKSVKCKVHNEDLKLFCLSCSCPVCLHCQIGGELHHNHESKLITTVQSGLREDVRRMGSQLDARAEELRQAAAQAGDCGAQLDKAAEAAAQTVRDFFAALALQLREREAMLHAEVAEVYHRKLAALGAHRDGLAQRIVGLSVIAAECRAAAAGEALSLLESKRRLEDRGQAALAAAKAAPLHPPVSSLLPVSLTLDNSVRAAVVSVGCVGGPPAPVLQVAQCVAGPETLQLVWAAGAGAASSTFELQVAPDLGEERKQEYQPDAGDAGVFRQVFAGAANSYRVTGLARASPFLVRVRARDAHGDWSHWCTPARLATTTGLRLTFVSAFDTNGVLYHVATNGKTQPYANPHDAKLVVAKWSSVWKGKESDFVSHPTPSSPATLTNNVANSWMEVDLGCTRKLAVDHYCLRNTPHQGGAAACSLLNWQLQGSNSPSSEGAQWVTLKQHDGDTSLPASAASVHHWQVDGASVAYRRFRVHQHGLNRANNNHLMCSGIELYGTLE